jgi:hypothetical protein
MTQRAPSKGLIPAAVGTVAALVVAFAVAGQQGLVGMGVGLAGASFGVTGLVLATGLVGRAASRGRTGGVGALMGVMAFLLKLPVYYVLWGLSQQIGGAAPACFLTGIVLVYLALVAWAVAR